MNAKNMLAIMLISALALSIAAWFFHIHSDRLTLIKQTKELRIGIINAEAPLFTMDENGNATGFFVLLGRRLAKDLLGDERYASFHHITHNAKEHIDMIFSLSTTPLSGFIHAAPYLSTSLSVLGNANAPSGLQALLNAPVLVREHSYAKAYFQTNYPFITLRMCENLAKCLRALQTMQQAYFADMDMLLEPILRKNPHISLSITHLGDPYTLAPLVRASDTALLQWLNDEIAVLQKEGFLTQIKQSALENSP